MLRCLYTKVQAVIAVQGFTAQVPCDITPSLPGEKMQIVIWFKENKNGKLSPIYTFDSRDNELLEKGKHWSDELVLGERAHFRFQDELAKLTINSVLHSDAGVYQCRVDFKQSPTRYSKVNLTVIIPPKQVSILNERRAVNSLFGPYNEGSSINITCVATGGFPTPKVTWWQNNTLLDDSYQNLPDSTTLNVLYIERLQRKHLQTVFTCQAVNNDIVAPLSSSIRLDLNLRPLSVKVLGENKPLSAGKAYALRCQVVGARPFPTISWLKGGVLLHDVREIKSANGTVTSILNFIPSLNDHGKYISCNAEQPLIRRSNMESGWKLNIQHVPVANLELGNKLASAIREGNDIYFDCNVKSNPWIYKVSWKRNGNILFSNLTAGIIINNQSLVLQDVTRDESGFYTCIASNTEGDGESNAIRIEIHFAPICSTRKFVTYHVLLHEPVKVRCELEANPSNVEFIWSFNNTEISSNRIYAQQITSSIIYTAETQNDYGTLFCIGVNKIGTQQDPCVFHIVRSDKPYPLSNCSILHQMHKGLLIKCKGGLNQTFVAEVYDLQKHILLTNISSKTPQFSIEGLSPGLDIEINLYAIDKKGRSKVTRLNALFPNLENLADAILPPENCSVTSQTRSHLRIKCQVPEIQRRKSLTYLLQVYDANSHALVGTSTSRSPEAITVTALPRDHQDLLLFIRGVDENSVTSDATILYAPAGAKTFSLTSNATAPVKFYITPTLIITISLVLVMLLMAVLILKICRFRGRNAYHHKQCDDSAVSLSNCHCSSNDRNTDNGESDAESKNPDIIPLKNSKIHHQDSIDELLCTGETRSYMKLQDMDGINNVRGVQPSFINQKSTTALPNRSNNLLQNQECFPLLTEPARINHTCQRKISVCQSQPFRKKPIPVAAGFQKNTRVCQPLLINPNVKTSSMQLPQRQNQLLVTQL